MKTRPIGNSGVQASVIGLGTWVLGGGKVWGGDPDANESIRAIQAAVDAGINWIDTAPAYGWGRSEELVGRAIRGRRDRVMVATKCGLWTDDDRGSFFTELDGRVVRRSLRPDTIAIEVERSLQRLRVDCIDLYQTHWPSTPPDFTPICDTLACLLKLKEAGKIKAIGVSNVSPAELVENVRFGAGFVASNQFRYSMLFRDPEKEMLQLCSRHGLATLTYMSLEQGLLTGKIGVDRVFGKDEFRSNDAWNPWFLPPNRPRVLGLLNSWRDLSDHYRCTLAQLVLAWTTSQAGVTHVLCGARGPAQAMENAAAGSLQISASDLERMRRDVLALGEPQSAANNGTQ